MFWEEEDEDFSWITPAGTPARPLPVALWQRIAPETPAMTCPHAVTVPYWESAQVDAVIPRTAVI